VSGVGGRSGGGGGSLADTVARLVWEVPFVSLLAGFVLSLLPTWVPPEQTPEPHRPELQAPELEVPGPLQVPELEHEATLAAAVASGPATAAAEPASVVAEPATTAAQSATTGVEPPAIAANSGPSGTGERAGDRMDVN
jgi:hypothetical protein